MTPSSIFGFPVVAHKPIQRYKLPADVPPPPGMTRQEFDEWSRRVCGFAPPTLALIAPNSFFTINGQLHMTEELYKRPIAEVSKIRRGAP